MEKKRTDAQRRSLEQWCKELAMEALNHGLSYRAVTENIQISWNQESVKAIVRAIGNAMYEKKSTADLTTTELTNVCKEVDKIFLEQGINILFPALSNENLIETYADKHK